MRWNPSAIILAAVLTLVVFWPALALLIAAVFGTTLQAGRGLIETVPWSNDWNRPLALAWQTVRMVGVTVALALPAGVLPGFLLFRTDAWGREFLRGVTALVLFVPMPLHATVWLGAFGNAGRSQFLVSEPWLTGWWGAAIIHAMAATPWVILLTGIGVSAVEPSLEESAALDLPGRKVALRISIRRAIAAIAVAALAIAVLTAGDMTVTDLLQVRTYAEEVYIQSQTGEGPATAAKVALPPLIVVGTAIFLVARVLLRVDPERLALQVQRARLWRLGLWRIPIGVLAFALWGGLLALPLIGLVWRAGRVAGQAVRQLGPSWSPRGLMGTLLRAWPDVIEPAALTYNPLRSPLVATSLWGALGAMIAVALAWSLLWKCRWSRTWRILAGLCLAWTLAAPGALAGLSLKLAYHAAQPGYNASLLQTAVFTIRTWIHDTPMILVLAYAQRTFPYAMLVLWAPIRGFPRAFLESAALDGIGPIEMIGRVAIPLTIRVSIAAWGVAFILAFGELPASHLVLPPGHVTLSTRVWMLLHTGVESHLAGVCLILLAIYAVAGFMALMLLHHAWTDRNRLD